MADEIQLFSKDALPSGYNDPGEALWQNFVKTKTTRAIKIDGPFRVMTSESENEPFYCEDGWLAIDARGYPYAIASDEFEQIYERVGEAEVVEEGEGYDVDLEFYKDADGDWRWRAQTANGDVVGAASEGYENRKDAESNFRLLREAKVEAG